MGIVTLTLSLQMQRNELRKTTPKDIRQAIPGVSIIGEGFHKLLRYILVPNLGVLRSIAQQDPDKFNAYASLIEGLVRGARDEGISKPFTLLLPPAKNLLSIDLVNLWASSEDRKRIIKRCFNAEEGIINLKPLGNIYASFLKEKNQKTE